jgi:acetoin utilization protein AcuB
MRCDEIMTRDVETVTPDLPATEAWERMRIAGIHHLVVMEGREVVGVISSRDLGGPRGGALRKLHTVAELMSPDPVFVEPETTVKRAANIMRGRSIGCLPVVRNGRLAGILTVSDLLDLVGQGIERRAPVEKRRRTRDPGGRRGPERQRPRASVRGRR